MLGEGTGKGLGMQSAASAAYEAIEHAVAFGRLGRTDTVMAVLPFPPFTATDRLYRYAQSRRGAAPLETLAFGSLSHESRGLLYPRIACDVSYVLHLPRDLDILFLDRYASTNGYAAGASRQDAIRHALHEIVERDAFSAYLFSPLDQNWSARPLVGALPVELAELRSAIAEVTASEVCIAFLPSVAGVVAMAYAFLDGAFVTGLGCGVSDGVAVERALTELHLELAAELRGITWMDEGGEPETNLDSYPHLQSLTHLAPPRLGEPRAFDARGGRGDLTADLTDAGFEAFARTAWIASPQKSTVWVVQVVVPGLEQMHVLLLNRPVVPVGHRWSKGLQTALLRKDGL